VTDRRVALLRGINVGKAKRIAMADLRALFEDLGYGDVRTLLNSGNVVFTVVRKIKSDHGVRIQKAIADQLGVETKVTVLLGKDVANAVRKNPLSSVADNPSRLLIMAIPDPKVVAKLRPLLEQRWAPEALALGKGFAYLWCAKGILDGPLSPAANKIVGDAGTARNLATMTKILALVEGA
jgi:uncharacterized protein (DUF1697 family)